MLQVSSGSESTTLYLVILSARHPGLPNSSIVMVVPDTTLHDKMMELKPTSDEYERHSPLLKASCTGHDSHLPKQGILNVPPGLPGEVKPVQLKTKLLVGVSKELHPPEGTRVTSWMISPEQLRDAKARALPTRREGGETGCPQTTRTHEMMMVMTIRSKVISSCSEVGKNGCLKF